MCDSNRIAHSSCIARFWATKQKTLEGIGSPRAFPEDFLFCWCVCSCGFQQTWVYPYPLGTGSARPNPKKGAPKTENPLFIGFTALRGGVGPWSQTMVLEGARPWGRARSELAENQGFPKGGVLRGGGGESQ